LLIQVLRSSA